jgi:hypothetical protein
VRGAVVVGHGDGLPVSQRRKAFTVWSFSRAIGGGHQSNDITFAPATTTAETRCGISYVGGPAQGSTGNRRTLRRWCGTLNNGTGNLTEVRIGGRLEGTCN